jgi:hypothetical protein
MINVLDWVRVVRGINDVPISEIKQIVHLALCVLFECFIFENDFSGVFANDFTFAELFGCKYAQACRSDRGLLDEQWFRDPLHLCRQPVAPYKIAFTYNCFY